MKLPVVLFASLKDRVGRSRIEVELPQDASTAELVAALGAQYPPLAPALGSMVIAVNREFAFEGVRLKPGDEIALFPPVSGGGFPEHCQIAEQAFDLDALVKAVTVPATGAVCVFAGIVRARTAAERAGGDRLRETTSLRYEAYRDMAEAKLRQVAQEIRGRWPDVQGIAIVQRVGLLAAGEPTVAVAVSAAHRDQGVFDAARYGIDRVKEIVPVWKQEIGPGGTEWVEGHYRPEPKDRASEPGG